ncbi:MAG TPA: phage tail tip lysozyme [Candidatus Saccharimonadales bacterium]|nr:phage tail tip lysozyme [Candidatus Saccharimonadales bacterium]
MSVVCCLLLGGQSGVSALTSQQQQAFNHGVLYFDTDASCEPADIAAGLAAVDAKAPHIQAAFQFLTDQGFTPAQAAGIVGNLMVESPPDIDPNAQGDYENGIPTSYGIAQWHLGRKTALLNWLDQNNYARNSFEGQLNYLMHELNSPAYQSFLKNFKQQNTPKDASEYWDIHYEVSTAASRPLRDKNAEAVYQQALTAIPPWTTGSAAGTTGGGSTTQDQNCGASLAGAGSTSADCKTAVGDAQILCMAEQYAGNWYVFGAGHEGYAGFRRGCPINQIAAITSRSTRSNPGPCATDCSSLVSVALDQAFGLDNMWVVEDITSGGTQWQHIPMASVQPGDIVTHNDPSTGRGEHVEIVDYYDAKTGVIHTFGSHQTGTQTSTSSSKIGHYFDDAWHWTGPGNVARSV